MRYWFSRLSFSFIIIALTRRVGGEMFLIFGIAILLFAVTSLAVWGTRQFRRNRAEKESASR